MRVSHARSNGEGGRTPHERDPLGTRSDPSRRRGIGRDVSHGSDRIQAYKCFSRNSSTLGT